MPAIGSRRLPTTLTLLVFVTVAAVAMTRAVADKAHLVSRCSALGSRRAREIIKEMVIPVLEEEAPPFALKPECAWNSTRDVYALFEKNKKRERTSQWQCLVCGKQFKSESYLDRHFERRHVDLIPESANVCLADHCGVLGCTFTQDERQMLKYEKKSNLGVASKSCIVREMEREQHLCHLLLDRCFPVEESARSHALHDRFVDHFCSHLHCGDHDHDHDAYRLAQQQHMHQHGAGGGAGAGATGAGAGAGAAGAGAEGKKRKRPSLEDIAAEQSRSKFYMVFVVVLLFLVGLFYVGLCVYRSEFSTRKDLTRVTDTGSGGFGLWKSKPKAKLF